MLLKLRANRSLPLFLGGVLLLILPLFFVGGPDWSAGPVYRSIWNLGHSLFFGLLTLATLLWVGTGGWRQALGLSIAVFLLGWGIEYLQSYVGRQVDWQDILRNLAGAWVVLAWQQARRVTAAALLLIVLAPLAAVTLEQYRIARQLPLLVDLQDPRTLAQWGGDVTLVRSLPGEPGQQPGNHPGLLLSLQTSRYSGAGMDNLAADWRGYQHLRLQLYNPDSDALTLTLRINDRQHERDSNAYHDRFNRSFLLQPGTNDFRIDLADIKAAPATRTMDMQRVRRLGLFATDLAQPRNIYLTQLQLEE